jgi:hypothetical protein
MNKEKKETLAPGTDMNWERRDTCIRDRYELGKKRHTNQGQI